MAGTYLLHGSLGSGRWLTALAIGALLNCENPIDDVNGLKAPCGNCRNCRTISDLNFEGLLFAVPLPPHKSANERFELTTAFLQEKRENPFKIMKSASSVTIPIEVARGIKKDLARRVGGEFRRIVIFYDMELMRQSSADALLKMIEEPPPDTTIILTSSRPEAILPTILSRSQKIKIDRISYQVVHDYVATISEVSENKNELYSRLSDGSIGQAIEMLNGADDEGASSRAVGFMLFKSLIWDGKPETVSHLNDMISSRNKGEAETLLKFWQSLIRDCGAYAVTGDESDIVNVDFVHDLVKIAPRFSEPATALSMASEIKITLADFALNVHIPGALTKLALKLKANLDLQN